MWMFARVLLFVAAIAGTALLPTNEAHERLPAMVKVMLALAAPFLAYVGLKYVVGFQAKNLVSAKRWTRPSWQSNFLNFRDPLHFVHMAAIVLLGSAIGLAIAGVFRNQETLLQAWACLGGALGLYIGVRRCEYLFPDKYAGGPSSATNGGAKPQ